MHKLFITIMSVALPVLSAASPTDEGRLLRFPSTNGTEIVFSYAGDLYMVPAAGGEARKITSSEGYEIFPRFSPDGKSIAFTGQYDGNTEVYLIPAKGGEPVRLTYSSTNSRDDLGDRMGPNNIVMTWSPDGKQIVYRNRIGDGFPGKLWKVSPEGGMPEALPLPEGGFSSFSPDGKKMAYNRTMREFRTWKYYKGGMADDIWIYDPEKGTVENITSNVAQDIVPMWIGNEIYFISDRDKTMNLFAYNTVNKTTRKVTDFTDYDIKFPSTDGKTIVFEKGGYIFRYDPAVGKAVQVPVILRSDNLQARRERRDVSGRISAVSVSPGGHRLAVTARGEVFDLPVGQGVTRNISRSPGSNDRDAQFSPDGKTVAWIGDATGESEIWTNTEGAASKQLTKDNDTYIRSFQWLPDGSKILYTDRKNRIVEVDPASGAKRTVIQNPGGEFFSVAVSPDSKWIAYTKSGDNDMAIVYLRNLQTDKEYPVTEKWYYSRTPVFSEDGKYLIFTSERDLNPTYGNLEWNHVYNNTDGLYVAMLAEDTPSPMLPKDDADPAKEEKPAPAKDSKADKKDKAESGNIVVDPEGIGRRIVRLPFTGGNYEPLYCNGKKLWYRTWGPNGGIKVFDFAKVEANPVFDGSVLARSFDGKKVVVGKGRDIYVVDFPTDKVSADKPVDLSGLVADVDYSQEWPQIFDEVWRAFRDGFYLENMHGVDWNAIKAKYAALLPWVKSRYDLNYIIGEMIGELACGHAYVNPGDVKGIKRVSMGLLGAELSRDASGYYRIDKILPGDTYRRSLRSPLDEPGIGVKEGEFIVAVDGIPVTETDNIYSLLIGKADVPTELTVNSKASEQGARKVVVKPIDNEYPLYHHAWVLNNIKKVEEATDGKVGYIYIPDMGPEGLNEFSRYYYPQLDKEALIIDDRENGGGNVSPMILERLMREPYRLTMSRTSDKIGKVPDGAHHGPKVLLINKYSASDGDLFPWSFKANKLGTVVGTRTWGGIIGISGSLPYMDGTDVRVPFFTNFDAKTGEWIVENHGVDPDILIDNDPVKEAAGIDQQLDKAIEVALEQIKNRKPLPGVPAPRTLRSLGVEE